jgi:hypothetical protein
MHLRVCRIIFTVAGWIFVGNYVPDLGSQNAISMDARAS